MRRVIRVDQYERDALADMKDVGSFSALEESGEMSWRDVHDARYLDPRTAAVLALGEAYLAACKRLQQRPPAEVRHEPIDEKVVFAAIAADTAAR